MIDLPEHSPSDVQKSKVYFGCDVHYHHRCESNHSTEPIPDRKDRLPNHTLQYLRHLRGSRPPFQLSRIVVGYGIHHLRNFYCNGSRDPTRQTRDSFDYHRPLPRPSCQHSLQCCQKNRICFFDALRHHRMIWSRSTIAPTRCRRHIRTGCTL